MRVYLRLYTREGFLEEIVPVRSLPRRGEQIQWEDTNEDAGFDGLYEVNQVRYGLPAHSVTVIATRI